MIQLVIGRLYWRIVPGLPATAGTHFYAARVTG
jgi:hypothetical protein